MKAVVYRHYGPPGVLNCHDEPKPTPGDTEVLVRVRAASINPIDWHFLRGEPYLLRLATGLRRPRVTRLGVDVSGQVETVGRTVTRFKAGDEVFGMTRGALAEYVCALEDALALRPDNATADQAAGVPVAALTALQGLRDKGRIQAGQGVLINGAAGGVGTFAVQIAKAYRAEVTGVCSTRNIELVRSLGADRVIDYTRENFTTGARRYDLILDMIGNHSLSDCRRALTPTGACVMVGGSGKKWTGPLGRVVLGSIRSSFASRRFVMIMARRNRRDLEVLRDFLASGKILPVIDRRFSLSETPAAIQYLETGHARGKVIITVAGSDAA